MKNRSCWFPRRLRRPSRGLTATVALLAAAAAGPATVNAASAPDWMRAQATQPLPTVEGKTEAVELYAETTLTVQPNGRMKRLTRAAFKILRPGGERVARVRVDYDFQSKITGIRAWCIPVSGKDYEVRERDAIDIAIPGIDGSELISEERTKLLVIPAASPGAMVGYEVEQEVRPYMVVDDWTFESTLPVRESRYTLQLPPGWNYEAIWSNHAPVEPVAAGPGRWQWTLTDIKAIHVEPNMPPWQGIAGRLVVAPYAPGTQPAMHSWADVGTWVAGLVRDRRQASPEIHRTVEELTASTPNLIDKARVLASFVQKNIRYVAIELGIGGQQPHPAADVLTNHYGDCKDKVTLLSTMLKEFGIDSDYVIINTARGSITDSSPPTLAFNHAILAIHVTKELEDPSLLAVGDVPGTGRVLYFDPTDTFTALGRLPGALQANYGLVLTAGGGRLMRLPQLPPSESGVERSARFTLDAAGRVTGTVRETRTGDAADRLRYAMQSVIQATDQIKPVERELSQSLASYTITKAGVGNLAVPEKPLVVEYSIELDKFAKPTGDLLLVRPSMIGEMSTGFLETDEPRTQSVEFAGPEMDKDVFEIEIPPGYRVEDLPPPVDLDIGAVAYHAKATAEGRVLRYSRSFEVRELSLPLNRVADLKKFYREIFHEEKTQAVLSREAH